MLGVTIDTKETLMGDVAETPCPPPSFHSVDVTIPVLQVRKLRLRKATPHSLRVAELRFSPLVYCPKTCV